MTTQQVAASGTHEGERSSPRKGCYLAYLASPEVSPRAMSENIALDLFGSHNTAEPTGVDAPVVDTGTVSVSPLSPETLLHAQRQPERLRQRGVAAKLDRLRRSDAEIPVTDGIEHGYGDAAFLATPLASPAAAPLGQDHHGDRPCASVRSQELRRRSASGNPSAGRGGCHGP